MKISNASYDAVWNIAMRMRDRDFHEFSAVSFAETRADLANQLAERYGTREDVQVAYDDAFDPICVGGTIMSRPNVVSLLFFATDRFPDIGLPITRYIKKEMFPRLIEAGVHRIEAVSIAGYTETHAWLETIGLERETGPMYGYGKGGEAYLQFSWCKDVRPFGARG